LILLITGPKHAGKTSAGKALQKKLGGRFVDLDALVEERAGTGVRSLYARGPEIFRAAEAAALASLPAETETSGPLIVAAGGGLIDNEEAKKLLAQRPGIIQIYLEVSAKTAWQRIAKAASHDGLPDFLKTENSEATHKALHERRAAACRAAASVIVDGENKTPDEAALLIENFLGTFSKK
jgi:shikimate kinase